MPKKVDRNQPLTVAALRALGFLVQPTHTVGGGFVDLVIAGESHRVSSEMLMVELKCNDWIVPPTDPRWTNTLTRDEQSWHVEWRMAHVVITNRVRWILAWFGWPDDYIHDVLLNAIPNDPDVKAALRDVRKSGDGTVSPEIMATIEFS